jgi:hypothetical protein
VPGTDARQGRLDLRQRVGERIAEQDRETARNHAERWISFPIQIPWGITGSPITILGAINVEDA